MSQQIFCGRPGCGLAKSAHGYLPDACSNFIGKGSREAKTMKRSIRCACSHLKMVHMCETSKCEVLGCKCGQFTVAKPDPKYISTDSRDLDTKVESSPVDSSILDRVLMAGALEHLQKRIKTATSNLQRGLGAQRDGHVAVASLFFEAALKALGDLGAS